MIIYSWKILQIFIDEKKIKVKYLLSANDESNVLQTEGYHTFSELVVSRKFEEIREEDLIRWLEKDTIKNDVNLIKLNLENQLKSLQAKKSVEFPWLANTFTVE